MYSQGLKCTPQGFKCAPCNVPHLKEMCDKAHHVDYKIPTIVFILLEHVPYYPGPVFYKLRGRKTGPGIHWQGPSAHALAITNTLGNRILL